MKKTEFMDLLRYYFRHSDKKDLREILSDCETRFHQGARKGMSEDEICAQLGSPKNIYRYYMGKPVIPADNPVIERQYAGGYDRVPRYNRDKARAYDWKREPEQRQRQAESRRHYRDYEEIREEPIYEDTYDYDERYSYEDDFFDGERKHRRKRPVQRGTGALERSFYTFLGGIFSFLGKIFFLLFLIAFVGSVLLFKFPMYTEILPIPKVGKETAVFSTISIFMAAIVTKYISYICHGAVKDTKKSDFYRS